MLIACLVITHRHVYKDVIAVVGLIICEDVRIIIRAITSDKAQSKERTVYRERSNISIMCDEIERRASI